MTLREVFQNTDWTELALQKLTLINVCNDDPALDGLLHWIDALQDAAEQEGFPVVWLISENC